MQLGIVHLGSEFAYSEHAEQIRTAIVMIAPQDTTQYHLETIGYISEILPHIEKTFFSAGLHRLVIECETDNIASAAVAERNGYVFEGIAAGKVFGYGRYRDCKVYAKVSGN